MEVVGVTFSPTPRPPKDVYQSLSNYLIVRSVLSLTFLLTLALRDVAPSVWRYEDWAYLANAYPM